MHLCQVVPYVSYPPTLGGDHRSHGIVKEFPELGDKVERFCQGGSPRMYKSFDLRKEVEISNNYIEYRHLHPLHELLKAPMLLGYPNVFQTEALKVASGRLDRMLEKADVVLVREPWQTSYVFNHVDQETPVLFSSHNVETERFSDIHQPLFSDWVERRVDRLEKQSVEKADAIVCTSERDATVYREKYDPGGPILVAPNGTYEESIREHQPNSERAGQVRSNYEISPESTVCLFMGSDYKPNVEAAEAVLEIARDYTDRDYQVHFLIMGSVGNSIDNSTLPENVTVTGYIEDEFEAHFDASDIALNPMSSGGGTNIKLIDYFARSLPVVSTPFGTRGLDVTDGKDIVLADLPDFPEAIEKLKDPQRRREIGKPGRQLANEKYTWEASSRKLNEFIHKQFGPF